MITVRVILLMYTFHDIPLIPIVVVADEYGIDFRHIFRILWLEYYTAGQR